MTWTLPEPMLAAPVSDPALLPGWAGEPKWDGFRALVSVDAGRVVLRSRRGTEMLPAFPEIGAGSAQLPDATALDGELVVWDAAGRLAFERLQNRLARRGAGAARAAEEWPAHFVAFDLLRLSGTGNDLLAVLAAQGRAGVPVRRPLAVGAMGSVPVDHRS
ncbi:hypothetical protein ABZS95_41245 [Streptomyces sp. NPDC005479]|uniref:ATP-dependent DNA ligase n=1 Tax=unclassified Streptomyces TaxID=2593676 RepID=UPI0033AB04E6